MISATSDSTAVKIPIYQNNGSSPAAIVNASTGCYFSAAQAAIATGNGTSLQLKSSLTASGVCGSSGLGAIIFEVGFE